jgi:hypothetical protein
VLFHILDEQDLYKGMEYIYVTDSICYNSLNIVYSNAVKFVIPSTLNCNKLPTYNLDSGVVCHIEMYENALKIKFAQCCAEKISNIFL